MTYPVWGCRQLSVPAMGLTCSDQRHPGSNTARPIATFGSVTRSSRPFPNVRVSSGCSKLFFSIPAIAVLPSRFRTADISGDCGHRDSGGDHLVLFD